MCAGPVRTNCDREMVLTRCWSLVVGRLSPVVSLSALQNEKWNVPIEIANQNTPRPAQRRTTSDQRPSRPRTISAMPNQIPAAIHHQKYISLTTFRKNGTAVATPVWFGEEDDKLYVMTRSDMGKTKRIRNNPQVTVAPCTVRGKVTGPEFASTARILPPEQHQRARRTLNRKYWMARIPFIWWRTDTYIEISFS